jgi:hypothetical protein
MGIRDIDEETVLDFCNERVPTTSVDSDDDNDDDFD